MELVFHYANFLFTPFFVFLFLSLLLRQFFFLRRILLFSSLCRLPRPISYPLHVSAEFPRYRDLRVTSSFAERNIPSRLRQRRQRRRRRRNDRNCERNQDSVHRDSLKFTGSSRLISRKRKQFTKACQLVRSSLLREKFSSRFSHFLDRKR